MIVPNNIYIIHPLEMFWKIMFWQGENGSLGEESRKQN